MQSKILREISKTLSSLGLYDYRETSIVDLKSMKINLITPAPRGVN